MKDADGLKEDIENLRGDMVEDLDRLLKHLEYVDSQISTFYEKRNLILNEIARVLNETIAPELAEWLGLDVKAEVVEDSEFPSLNEVVLKVLVYEKLPPKAEIRLMKELFNLIDDFFSKKYSEYRFLPIIEFRKD
jgi:hypothetical protein